MFYVHTDLMDKKCGHTKKLHTSCNPSRFYIWHDVDNVAINRNAMTFDKIIS